MEPRDDSHEPAASSDEFAAFLETARIDTQEQEKKDSVLQEVRAQVDETLASLGYTPLTIGSSRFESELGIEFEVKLGYVAEQAAMDIEYLRSLPDDHEIKQMARTLAMSTLEIKAFQEEGLLAFLIDDLVQLKLDLQAHPSDYNAILETYDSYKKQLYAFWNIRQDLPPDHFLLIAVSKLFPGPEIDPSSEAMVPYFAEAYLTIPERDKAAKEDSDLKIRLSDLLGLDNESDTTYDKRHAVNIIVSHAKLLQKLGNCTRADREEELRKKAREEGLPLSELQLTSLIENIDRELPIL